MKWALCCKKLLLQESKKKPIKNDHIAQKLVDRAARAAVSTAQEAMVRLFLEQEFDADFWEAWYSPDLLCSAATSGNLRIFQLLLEIEDKELDIDSERAVLLLGSAASNG
jgi:hypothetical protein